MDNTPTANTTTTNGAVPLATDDVTAELPEPRKRPEPVSARSILTGLVADIAKTHEKHRAGEWTGGIRCGIPLIDATLRGFRPSSVSYLLAPPNVGKSTLANQLAYQVAAFPSQSAAALYISYENPPANLLIKQIARLSGWTQTDIESGAIDTKDKHFDGAITALSAAPLYYMAGGKNVTFDDIRSAVNTVRDESGAEYVFCVIDYLQYYSKASTNKESRYEQVNAAVVDMRELANSTAAHVMVISSQNRAENLSKEVGKGMHGATGSGDVEYDADLMLSLAPKEEKNPTVLFLTATKTRYGGKHKKQCLLFNEDLAVFTMEGQPE